MFLWSTRLTAAPRGCIDTEMMEQPFDSPMGQFYLTKDNIPSLLKGRLAEPWEIAASIAFLLGDESKYITKAVWDHDGVSDPSISTTLEING